MLTIEALEVSYRTDRGAVPAVRGVDLVIRPGETLGIVGESGCGKTSVARALLGMLPRTALVTGSVRLGEQELVGADEATLRSVRGGSIALVPQGAQSGLDPVMRVGDQIVETIRAHSGMDRAQARERAGGLLDRVGLDQRWLRRYPHELSGGMRQRAVIASAVAAGPDVLVADEPTTGLDVIAQARVLTLLRELREQLGLALILVSHDLRAVMKACDRLAVMYAGRVVEQTSAADTQRRPLHPYTAGLIKAVPRIARESAWVSIPGAAPDLTALPPGCPFQPRCPHAHAACSQDPPLRTFEDGRQAACHLHDTEMSHPSALVDVTFPFLELPPRRSESAEEVVAVSRLTKRYSRRTLLGVPHVVDALVDVDFAVHRGEIAGLIGRSGSGKSTLARILLALVAPTSGEVIVAGLSPGHLHGRALRDYRRRISLVPQDPYGSLHPGMRVAAIVAEPLAIGGIARRDRLGRVQRALEHVGLDSSARFLTRVPSQLSGGQRQRVALARALVNEPQLLIADEPTSMLDVSVRAGIAQTLLQLRTDLDLSIVFITHDLAEAAHVCDSLHVLEDGQVVEHGPARDVTNEPRHRHTRELVQAVLDPTSTATDLRPTRGSAFEDISS